MASAISSSVRPTRGPRMSAPNPRVSRRSAIARVRAMRSWYDRSLGGAATQTLRHRIFWAEETDGTVTTAKHRHRHEHLCRGRPADAVYRRRNPRCRSQQAPTGGAVEGGARHLPEMEGRVLPRPEP